MSPPLTPNKNEIAAIQDRLAELDAERRKLVARLAEQTTQPPSKTLPASGPPVSADSTPASKIALFRSLFRGRDDVYPKRWTNSRNGKSGYAPACTNEWVPGLCGKPRVKCADCPNRAFVEVTDTIINRHLRGEGPDGRDFTIGVYPMLTDETCWFLAADFDKATWQGDVSAFLATCGGLGVPAALERSRSGNGGHVWIFFSGPVSAASARRLGSLVLTETMERHPDIGFESYDRFFPSQDTMPAGGFGNLIALPLQRRPRQSDNSVFIDGDFQPYADQWSFLSSIKRMTPAEVSSLTEEAGRKGRIVGLRLPLDDENEEPWLAPPSRRTRELPIASPLPDDIEVVLGDQIYIDRDTLPTAMVNRLVRLAAFQNPEFYAAQRMRLPAYGIPRIISCAELLPRHIGLPRGCRDRMTDLLSSHGIAPHYRDERNSGDSIDANFLGELTQEQQAASNAVIQEDIGVLSAGTAFGKTVVSAHVIAGRGTNTLVLVHRRQLLDQWIARLGTFLDMPPTDIGQIGGGKRKPTGIIDVAVIQSLVRKGEVDDMVAEYGQLIVDECHHLPAVSFEAVARRCKARYVLGLSATVVRKDGRHPIIFMQCGPVRFRADERRQAARRSFRRRVILRSTCFSLPLDADAKQIPIQQIYGALCRDRRRNDLIFDDVLKALESKRSPVVLTERKEHAQQLAERLSPFARNVILLHGGMGVKARRMIADQLEAIADSEERILIATGRYIGEGFDDARLDTLFLTMPISWRGTLAQYAGRLHRLHPDKKEVIIYDYVDDAVPVLARMSGKRVSGYRNMGYSVTTSAETVLHEGSPTAGFESG